MARARVADEMKRALMRQDAEVTTTNCWQNCEPSFYSPFVASQTKCCFEEDLRITVAAELRCNLFTSSALVVRQPQKHFQVFIVGLGPVSCILGH